MIGCHYCTVHGSFTGFSCTTTFTGSSHIVRMSFTISNPIIYTPSCANGTSSIIAGFCKDVFIKNPVDNHYFDPRGGGVITPFLHFG